MESGRWAGECLPRRLLEGNCVGDDAYQKGKKRYKNDSKRGRWSVMATTAYVRMVSDATMVE